MEVRFSVEENILYFHRQTFSRIILSPCGTAVDRGRWGRGGRVGIQHVTSDLLGLLTKIISIFQLGICRHTYVQNLMGTIFYLILPLVAICPPLPYYWNLLLNMFPLKLN